MLQVSKWEMKSGASRDDFGMAALIFVKMLNLIQVSAMQSFIGKIQM